MQPATRFLNNITLFYKLYYVPSFHRHLPAGEIMDKGVQCLNLYYKKITFVCIR